MKKHYPSTKGKISPELERLVRMMEPGSHFLWLYGNKGQPTEITTDIIAVVQELLDRLE